VTWLHRTALHEAQEHRVGVGPQQPVAAEGLGIRIVLLGLELLEAQGPLGTTPSVQLRAQPTGSTKSHQQTPAPSRDGFELSLRAARGLFFSGVGRVRAADPLLGPLPAQAQALDGLAHRLGAQDVLAEALLVTDFGRQRQRPVALGTAGAARQAVGPLLLEGVEGVADRLGGAAQGGGDLGRPLALRAGQQDLAAAQRKSVPGVQAGAQLLALFDRQGPHKQRRFHRRAYHGAHLLTTRPWRLH